MKDNLYIATTTDKFENIVDLADTLKELCSKVGVSYNYCKKDSDRIFYSSNGTPIFIKKVNVGD